MFNGNTIKLTLLLLTGILLFFMGLALSMLALRLIILATRKQVELTITQKIILAGEVITGPSLTVFSLFATGKKCKDLQECTSSTQHQPLISNLPITV